MCRALVKEAKVVVGGCGAPTSGPSAFFQIASVKTSPPVCLHLVAVSYADTVGPRAGTPWAVTLKPGLLVSKTCCLPAVCSHAAALTWAHTQWGVHVFFLIDVIQWSCCSSGIQWDCWTLGLLLLPRLLPGPLYRSHPTFFYVHFELQIPKWTLWVEFPELSGLWFFSNPLDLKTINTQQ
jgi:hypothetical protein